MNTANNTERNNRLSQLTAELVEASRRRVRAKRGGTAQSPSDEAEYERAVAAHEAAKAALKEALAQS